MSARLLCVPVFCLLLAACVTPPPPAPRIVRMPVEQSRPASAEPRLTLDELLAMSKGGATAEAVISRFRQSGERFDLTPQQIVDLQARGMPMAVLQAIHEDRERALRNELAQQLADFDRQCADAVQRERQRPVVCPDPYWPRPYGGFWGGYPYRRGGMFWGW